MHTAAGVLVGTRKPLQRCVSRQEGGPLTASFIGPVVQPQYMSTSHSQTPASNSRNVSKAVTQVQKHTPLLQEPPPLSPPQGIPSPAPEILRPSLRCYCHQFITALPHIPSTTSTSPYQPSLAQALGARERAVSSSIPTSTSACECKGADHNSSCTGRNLPVRRTPHAAPSEPHCPADKGSQSQLAGFCWWERARLQSTLELLHPHRNNARSTTQLPGASRGLKIYRMAATVGVTPPSK
jgi:hypothetical protein